MLEQVIWGVVVRDSLLALSTVAGAVLASVIAHVLVHWISRRVREKGLSNLGDILLTALEWPVIGTLLASGVYLASFFFPLLPWARDLFDRGFRMVVILLLIFAAFTLVDGLLGWYRREVASKSGIALDDKLAQVLITVAPLIALLAALLALLDQLGVDLGPTTTWLLAHGSRLGLIVVLTVAAVLIVDKTLPKLIVRTVTAAAEESDIERDKRATTLTRALVTTGQVVAIVAGIFMVLSELGVNIGPVLAGLGVAGLAFGFGGQYLVRDLIAGTFIILENHYRVGDVARVADIAGLVTDINLRRTVLRDLDGIVHIVPNGEIRVASNFTREFSRVNMNVSVAYGTDLDHAIAVINRVCNELAQDPDWAPHLVTTPQVLRVDNLGDSGIDIKILGDTKPIQQWAIMGELRKRIKKAFDQEGIEIPWPHTKVFFGNQPPSGA